MANIVRFRTIWNNFPGAPGYTNLYVSGAEDPTVAATTASALRDFWVAIDGLIPTGTQLQVQGTADVIEDTTGQIVDQVSFTTPTPVTATGAGAYSGTSGALIDWLTSTYRNGRRVRGRSYIVPIVASAYDTNGSLLTGTITTLTGAAQAWLAATDGASVVWSRPTATHPVGGSSVINSSAVPDLAVVMRSRRT